MATPRTDAARIRSGRRDFVDARFAEELEKELDALQEKWLAVIRSQTIAQGNYRPEETT